MLSKKFFMIAGASLGLAIAVSGGVVGIVYAKTGLSMPYYVRSLQTNRVSVAELREIPPEEKLIIDVRTPEEHSINNIPNSVLIPIQDLEAGFGVKQLQREIQAFQTKHGRSPQIIFYCQTGPRSIRAFETLKTQIDEELLVLTGGMSAWDLQS